MNDSKLRSRSNTPGERASSTSPTIRNYRPGLSYPGRPSSFRSALKGFRYCKNGSCGDSDDEDDRFDALVLSNASTASNASYKINTSDISDASDVIDIRATWRQSIGVMDDRNILSEPSVDQELEQQSYPPSAIRNPVRKPPPNRQKSVKVVIESVKFEIVHNTSYFRSVVFFVMCLLFIMFELGLGPLSILF